MYAHVHVDRKAKPQNTATLSADHVTFILFHLNFRHMPGHASREILVLFGSLTSCDPGDIVETIQVMTAT